MILIQKIDETGQVLLPSSEYDGSDYFKQVVDTNSIPVGYVSINTAENWDVYGFYVKDYIFYRDEIKELLIPLANPSYPTINYSGWGSLTVSQKELMARYILAPYVLRTTIFSDVEDKALWFELLDKTQGNDNTNITGRALIIENMRKTVANKVRIETMTLSSSQTFYKDVRIMIQSYIAAADPNFKQWLTNAIGTIYELAGFEQKNYYSIHLRDELINIYNGIF